jgi:hypothetical protein
MLPICVKIEAETLDRIQLKRIQVLTVQRLPGQYVHQDYALISAPKYGCFTNNEIFFVY